MSTPPEPAIRGVLGCYVCNAPVQVIDDREAKIATLVDAGTRTPHWSRCPLLRQREPTTNTARGIEPPPPRRKPRRARALDVPEALR